VPKFACVTAFADDTQESIPEDRLPGITQARNPVLVTHVAAYPPAVMHGLGLSVGEAVRLPLCSPQMLLGTHGSTLGGSPVLLRR
jgi:hypothetical protein